MVPAALLWWPRHGNTEEPLGGRLDRAEAGRGRSGRSGHSAVGKGLALPFATTRVGLEDITLSEISQTERS